jgi:hypothetical protein
MSVAMPAAKGSQFSIAGRKISWDALLIAAAGVAGVVFLYKAGQPGTSVGSVLPADSGAASSVLSDFANMPLDPTAPAGAATKVQASGYKSFFSTTAPLSNAPLPGTTINTAPVAPNPGQLATVSAFQPIASSLGGLLPGILTPARAPSLVTPAGGPRPFLGGILPGILTPAPVAPAMGTPYNPTVPTPSASGRSL